MFGKTGLCIVYRFMGRPGAVIPRYFVIHLPSYNHEGGFCLQIKGTLQLAWGLEPTLVSFQSYHPNR